ARLGETREGGGISRDHRVRTGEAAQEVRAELAFAGPGGKSRERVLAVKTKHRHGGPGRNADLRARGRLGLCRLGAARRSRYMAEEGLLESGDAHSVSGFDLGGFDVA